MRLEKTTKIIVLTLCGIGTFCCMAYFALLLVLQSPAMLNNIASALGYEVSVSAISFSPDFSGQIDDLRINDANRGFTVVCSNVTVKNSLDMLFTGQIDSLVLRNPKLTFRSNDSKSDLSFLKKLPDVRLLDIQNAEIDYLAGSDQELKLTNFNLKVKDLSPKRGGNISLHSNFSYNSGAETKISVKGKIASMVQLAGFYPKPYGIGSVDLTVDSGEYLSGGRTISLNEISLAVKLVYDRRTETFTIDSMNGKSREFGPVKATAKAVMTGSMPWSMNLSISSIDFAKVFAVVRPFMAKDMKGWTMKGNGGAEIALEGIYMNKQISFSGTVALSFKETGASSPDSTIAAQGVSGKVVLKLNYSSPEQKLAFNLYSIQQDGELLWKDYYNNLNGQQASVTADGAFFLTQDIPFSFSAAIDNFQTGDYSVSMSGNRNDWTMKATAVNVSHEKVIEKILKEYLKSTTSGLKGLTATGYSSIETVIQRDNGITYVSGVIRMTDTAINAPDLQLSIGNISADLPFELVRPSSARKENGPTAKGSIHFTDVRSKRLNIKDIDIPLAVAQNMMEVPEPVVIPLFGGKMQIYKVMADDLLSRDMQVRFGLKIENINLGSLTRGLLEVELPGTFNADFGVMIYQNDGLKSDGTAVINIFGGEVKATNFFARDITLPSRKFGGDITFRDINLDDVTGKLAVGRMSGIIRGGLKGFVMEYGQPASFILEVESEKRSGVRQVISADAIDNISILGTGAGSGLGKTMMKIFNDFPYSRIGFRCVLRNDQFTVNGTIIEGGKEYLVRRGLFRGVDVINQNRNNVISFRDMEERVKRISRPAEMKSGGMLVQ